MSWIIDNFYLWIRDGIPSYGHLIMIIWGMSVMIGSLLLVWLTIKADRKLQIPNHQTIPMQPATNEFDRLNDWDRL